VNRDEKLNYQQLWAEIKIWYDAKETWYLSQPELEILRNYSDKFCVQSYNRGFAENTRLNLYQ